MKDWKSLKRGDKIRATFWTSNKQRTYVVIGELYTPVHYPRSLFIGPDILINYYDTDGVFVPNPHLKSVRRAV